MESKRWITGQVLDRGQKVELSGRQEVQSRAFDKSPELAITSRACHYLQSLPLPLGLAAISRACSPLRSKPAAVSKACLPPHSEPPTVFGARCNLKSSLPPPDLPATSRPSRYLQTLPLPTSDKPVSFARATSISTIKREEKEKSRHSDNK
jgi:hypothetical protein